MPGEALDVSCPKCGAPAGMACVAGPAMSLRPAATHEARQALQAYAERKMVSRDTTIIGELAPLVDRAKSAGLSVDTIAALAAGREA